MQKFFRILDPLGLNFNAINLKLLLMVGLIVVYSLWKFQIYSIKNKIKALPIQNAEEFLRNKKKLFREKDSSTFRIDKALIFML